MSEPTMDLSAAALDALDARERLRIETHGWTGVNPRDVRALIAEIRRLRAYAEDLRTGAILDPDGVNFLPTYDEWKRAGEDGAR